jgi:ribonuclease-3 family protein
MISLNKSAGISLSTNAIQLTAITARVSASACYRPRAVVIDLRQRSVRTLAWIGDVEFERVVRLGLCRRGDYPTNRLDTLRAKLVSAEAQASLLAELIERGLLSADELALVGRARNAAVRGAVRRDVRTYRAATAFEALIGAWLHGGDAQRFAELIEPAIEQRIDALLRQS